MKIQGLISENTNSGKINRNLEVRTTLNDVIITIDDRCFNMTINEFRKISNFIL